MTKVNPSKDCGNSPKNKFTEALGVAIEKCDVKLLDKALDQNATITLATGESLSRDEYLALLKSATKPTIIKIDRVATHGYAGAVDGVSRLGRKGERRFCHVIHFANIKADRVAHISSYGCSNQGY